MEVSNALHQSVDVPGDVPPFPGHIWTERNVSGASWKEDSTAVERKIQFFRRSPQHRTLAPVNSTGLKSDEWRCLSIAVDSGACENVIGPDDIPGYQDDIKETAESLKGESFVSASGEEIPNYGEVTLPLVTREHGIKALRFQAAGVAKPLLSAERLNQSGHYVVLTATKVASSTNARMKSWHSGVKRATSC